MVNKRSVDKDLQLCSVLILRYIFRFFIRRNDGFFNKRIVHVAFCDKLIRRIFCQLQLLQQRITFGHIQPATNYACYIAETIAKR